MTRPVLLGAATGLAVVVGIGLALLGSRGEAGFRGSQPPERIELPAFSLRDADGRRVSSRELAGKVVLVTFLDTKCTEACPIVAEQLREGLARLDDEERRDTVAIAISPSAVRSVATTPGENERRASSIQRYDDPQMPAAAPSIMAV